MFNKQNFCHVASNNRNEKKAGIFVYKTTDNLATVSASGYFNEKIIDLNLHDLIIHEQTDNADRTKVKYNYLAVTERTLDNVGTTVIKRDLDITLEQAIADLQTYVDTTFVRKDGTSIMTGPLKFSAGSMRGAIAGGLNGLTFFKMDSEGLLTQIGSLSDTQFVPAADNTLDIGTSVRKVERMYIGKLNNGYDIDVPVTNSADTLALKSQVDDAANSGEQLYTTGVWFAKMYAATVVPTGAEYDGKNYADFSQTNNDGDPIIVVYEGQSGAWVQIATITPPANHNGYMTITSKIWDIVEQAGQQGGLVLWSHNQKTFTPYPRIVSFDGANITNSTITTSTFSGSATLDGTSTVTMPANPGLDQIVNKDYVDNQYLPAGTVLTFAGTTVPTGFLKCNGAAVSRTTYARLFAAIGTTYGAGDGSTTFNLPNQTAEGKARLLTGTSVGAATISANGPLTVKDANGTLATFRWYLNGNQDGARLWDTGLFTNGDRSNASYVSGLQASGTSVNTGPQYMVIIKY